MTTKKSTKKKHIPSRRPVIIKTVLLILLALASVVIAVRRETLPPDIGNNIAVVKIYAWRDSLLKKPDTIVINPKVQQKGYDAADRQALDKLISKGAEGP